MQLLDVSSAVRPIYGSLGVKRLIIGIYFEIFTRILSVMSEHILKLFSVYFQTNISLFFSVTVIKFD